MTKGYYIMTKGSIQQEHVVILNWYTTNNRAAKYVKQNLIEPKGKIDKSTVNVNVNSTFLSKQLVEYLNRKSTRI